MVDCDCYRKDSNYCSMQNVSNTYPVFCTKLCPKILKYTSLKEHLKTRLPHSEVVIVPKRVSHEPSAQTQKAAEPVYRSLASFAVTVCTRCQQVETCQPYRDYVHGKSKCDCAGNVIRLADECPEKIYCRELVRNWEKFRDLIDPIYEQLDKRFDELHKHDEKE